MGYRQGAYLVLWEGEQYVTLPCTQAIIELQTGVQLPAPSSWPFTRESNEEQETQVRLSYVRGLRDLVILAL